MVSPKSATRYSIVTIREEAINLLQIGVVELDQPLRILCEYLPAQQWNTIECELERHDYLLRDSIVDLVGKVDWNND